MRPADPKDALRQTIQSRRRKLASEEWSRADAARTELLLSALGDRPATVALYASRANEPGTHEAITQLHEAGWQVLLPVLGSSPRWAPFRGWQFMRRGWGEILEPSGPGREIAGIVQADVVVTPCLAVALDGTRLGTGGGWYDRALPHRRPGVPVWALAGADEVFDALPAEPHDVPVDRVITELGSHACAEAAVPGISAQRHGELS